MATSIHPWRQSKNETTAAWSGRLTRGQVLRWLIHCQSAYYAVMAAWPLVDIESFMAVTGPKTDLWLVKTVSWLLLATALTLETALRSAGSLVTAAILGFSNAFALGAVDIYYTQTKTISPVYRLDAIVEFLLVLVWLAFLTRSGRWRR